MRPASTDEASASSSAEVEAFARFEMSRADLPACHLKLPFQLPANKPAPGSSIPRTTRTDMITFLDIDFETFKGNHF
jgi:hypothetical protein